ncbi:hypothetical protein [Pseudomonas juntendi]|nr:hypothetical protein [Pseudomonas juntendi]
MIKDKNWRLENMLGSLGENPEDVRDFLCTPIISSMTACSS